MMIEALALGVLLVFPTWMEWGLDRWFWRSAKG
jgi:hypothetical protein